MLLKAQNLQKTFRIGFWRKKVEAVRDVSFEVRRGEIFGLVGPNGAGKTTTMKMLTGLIRPDAGSMSLFGEPVDHVRTRAKLGYLPENPYFYDHLTARELITYYGSLHGLKRSVIHKRADELLEQVGLAHAQNRPLRKFSKGMRQRAGLAQALINDPELVILDEPQSGLDPMGRKDVRDLIFDLKRRGKTVFFSSHILPDVEAVCDRVALMHLGTVREVGTLQELTGGRAAAVEVLIRGLDLTKAKSLSDIDTVDARGDLIALELGDEAALQATIAEVYRLGGAVHSVTPQKEDLEDVFLRDTRAENIS
ncbi:ABC transporter ATP-binding protein [Bradymonas sediminis]|uniref:ABC transporter ATP-binding protein n=1 Tax=Bradymonas sediminis TaxID=1548548 RepID=A0A2Z4FR49_9DELT|nr:ABC transporter ATP-binding protein [Bradymonas sediminis]